MNDINNAFSCIIGRLSPFNMLCMNTGCVVMQYGGINLSNKSAEGSASISTQSLPENGLLFINEPKNPGKFIVTLHS